MRRTITLAGCLAATVVAAFLAAVALSACGDEEVERPASAPADDAPDATQLRIVLIGRLDGDLESLARQGDEFEATVDGAE